LKYYLFNDDSKSVKTYSIFAVLSRKTDALLFASYFKYPSAFDAPFFLAGRYKKL